MRWLLLLVFILRGSCAVTQPLIDSANFTPLMDELFARQRCKFTSINYRSSGPNYTWNFLSAPFVSVDTLIYDSVDSNNCDNHNYSAFAGRNFSFRLIATNLSCVSNFKTYSASGLTEAGYGQPNDVGDFNYVHFPFPLTITTNISVTENYTAYHLSPFSTWSHVYYHSILADGFGDLNLPGGISYTNCLRVREVIYDTSGVSTPSYDTVFYWMKPGMHHPVLEVYSSTPWQDAYYVKYIDRVNVSYKSNSLKIGIYPNPTEGVFFVSIDGPIVADHLIITNTLGEVVLDAPLEYHNSAIDIVHLRPGIYLAHIGPYFTKIVKQ